MPGVEAGLVGVSVVVVVSYTDGGEGELLHGVLPGEGLLSLQVVPLGLAELMVISVASIPVIKKSMPCNPEAPGFIPPKQHLVL